MSLSINHILLKQRFGARYRILWIVLCRRWDSLVRVISYGFQVYEPDTKLENWEEYHNPSVPKNTSTCSEEAVTSRRVLMLFVDLEGFITSAVFGFSVGFWFPICHNDWDSLLWNLVVPDRRLLLGWMFHKSFSAYVSTTLSSPFCKIQLEKRTLHFDYLGKENLFVSFS